MVLQQPCLIRCYVYFLLNISMFIIAKHSGQKASKAFFHQNIFHTLNTASHSPYILMLYKLIIRSGCQVGYTFSWWRGNAKGQPPSCSKTEASCLDLVAYLIKKVTFIFSRKFPCCSYVPNMRHFPKLSTLPLSLFWSMLVKTAFINMRNILHTLFAQSKLCSGKSR